MSDTGNASGPGSGLRANHLRNGAKGEKKWPSAERDLVTLKLHLLVGCCRGPGFIPILRARVTRGEAHDSPHLKPMVGGFKGGGGPFLLDTGYDSEGNYIFIKNCGLVPVIKLRKIKPRRLIRVEMAKSFELHEEVYRYRGLIEKVFGGTEIKYGNLTRCRRTKSRKVDCLLVIVSHNLRTYMRALALKELKIFVLIWIY